MPTYQYECGHCNHSFEFLQSMLDEKLKECPECKELKLHRLIGSGAGIIFKGSGFYETDYKKSSSSSVGQSGIKKKENAKTELKPAKEKSKSLKSSDSSKK